MKDLRFVLSIFVLILVVLLLSGCNGITPAPPSPGTTEDDVTTISGQILMPTICCLPLPEEEEAMSKDNGCNETEFWAEIANARVELKSAEKCNNVLDETFTDSSGYYEFEDVKPGLYIITAYCTEDDGFVVKDVAVKVEGEALNAGIPDCTSTGIALVLEEINGCYNDFYQCFGKYTKIYDKVESIAEAIGEVNIQNILNQYQAIESIDTLAAAAGITDVQPILDDFGDVCDSDLYGLVDMICEWNCCLAPGATGGNGDEEEDVTYDLTMQVSPEGGGTTTPSVGGSPHTYDEGTEVGIVATPDEGYQFTGWTVDLGAAGNVDDTGAASTDVTMNEDMTLTANFELIPPTQYTLTLNAGAGGSVNDGVNGDYDEGTEVGIVATPDEGYQFTGWTVDLGAAGNVDDTGAASTDVTMNEDMTLTANFELIPPTQYTLTLNAGAGGSVNDGVNGDYDEGTEVGIVATPDEGYQFTGWTVDLGAAGNVVDTGAASTDVTMNEDMTLTANFELIPPTQYTLTLNAGAGGSVNDGVNGDYDEGTEVGIVATPDEGYQFTGWTVDLGAAGNVDDTGAASTDVTMNEDMTLTANFELIPPTQYTLTLNAGAGGSVNDGVNGDYDEGTEVGIVATPDEGYQFTGWTVDLGAAGNVVDTGAASTDVTMNEDMTLTANFEPLPCSITVVKERDEVTIAEFDTPYPGSPWEFNFDGDAFFSLPDCGLNWQRTFDNLNSGTYTVTETQKWGYDCNITVNGVTGDSYTINPDCSIEIELDPGDDVTITFQNSWGFDRSDNQHILVTDPSSGLQDLVNDHPYGVLANINLSTGSGDYPNPYFYVDLKTHSGSYDETSLLGWCITNNLNINSGTDYTVVLFPADSANPSIGSTVEKVWGILGKADEGYPKWPYTYTISNVQDAIWKATDGVGLPGYKVRANYLYDNSTETTGNGIIAIPVTSTTKAGRTTIFSRDLGVPVDKNK